VLVRVIVIDFLTKTQSHGEGEEEKFIRSRPQDVGDTWAHQDGSARVITQIAADFF
jgi:hypothetical protein